MASVYGIDTMEYSADFEGYENFINQVENWRDQLDQSDDKAIVEFNGQSFILDRAFRRNYSVSLRNDNFVINLARKKNNQNYPVFIILRSFFLWQVGYKKAFEIANNTVEKITGSKYMVSKVSRLDMCCDTDNMKFQTLEDLIDVQKTIVSRAKKQDVYYQAMHMEGKKATGISIGKGDIMARIYDKSYEIEKSSKEWFRQIWDDYGLGDNVTRIEYQMRRDALREFTSQKSGLMCESVEDVFEMQSEIWAYLTTSWLSLRIIDNDLNVTRAEYAFCWEEIITVMGRDIKVKRHKIHRNDLKYVLPVLNGLLESVAVSMDIDDVFNTFKFISQQTDDKKFKDNVKIKRSLKGVA